MEKILGVVEFLSDNNGTPAQWDALLERIMFECSHDEICWIMSYRRLGGNLYTDLSMRMAECGKQA